MAQRSLEKALRLLNNVPRLGEIIVSKGLVSEEQIFDALEQQKTTGKKLGEILIENGLISKSDLLAALAEQFNLKTCEIGFWEKPPVGSVPAEIVKKYQVYPLRVEGQKLFIASATPFNVEATDEIAFLTGYDVVVELAAEEDVKRAIHRWYGENYSNYGEYEEKGNETDAREDDVEGPVVRLTQELIEAALLEGATDIHIEPTEDSSAVRFRVDGRLRDVSTVPKRMHGPLVSRIKIMAGLDIAERRVPQDGQIRLEKPHRAELRVSTLPTVNGEKVVLRVLDKTRVVPKLDALGFDEKSLALLRRAFRMPYGLILVTGPTGSGKTTTLYAAMEEIVDRSINVVTVEDPPEYQMEGINQVAINPKAGVTFATVLRSVLRQDPDVIMVGEIRDPETAKIAVQAAMTGHLVLSTLHTNDAASAPVRLVDMGVEPYLIASCLLCVVAQRLVRLNCPECAEDYTPPVDSPVWAFLNGASRDGHKSILRRGRGCSGCENTGVKGRMAIAEVMNISKKMRELIRVNASADEIRRQAVAEGMATLLDSAREKVTRGLVAPEEGMRVVAFTED